MDPGRRGFANAPGQPPAVAPTPVGPQYHCHICKNPSHEFLFLPCCGKVACLSCKENHEGEHFPKNFFLPEGSRNTPGAAISLLIDSSATRYDVNLPLLLGLPFFAHALRNFNPSDFYTVDWTMRTRKPRFAIMLPDFRSAAVRIFLLWLYGGNENESELLQGAVINGVLPGIYGIAHTLGVPKVQNRVIKYWDTAFRRNKVSIYHDLSMAHTLQKAPNVIDIIAMTNAYKETEPGSKLRQFAACVMSQCLDSKHIFGKYEHQLEILKDIRDWMRKWEVWQLRKGLSGLPGSSGDVAADALLGLGQVRKTAVRRTIQSYKAERFLYGTDEESLGSFFVDENAVWDATLYQSTRLKVQDLKTGEVIEVTEKFKEADEAKAVPDDDADIATLLGDESQSQLQSRAELSVPVAAVQPPKQVHRLDPTSTPFSLTRPTAPSSPKSSAVSAREVGEDQARDSPSPSKAAAEAVSADQDGDDLVLYELNRLALLYVLMVGEINKKTVRNYEPRTKEFFDKLDKLTLAELLNAVPGSTKFDAEMNWSISLACKTPLPLHDKDYGPWVRHVRESLRLRENEEGKLGSETDVRHSREYYMATADLSKVPTPEAILAQLKPYQRTSLQELLGSFGIETNSPEHMLLDENAKMVAIKEDSGDAWGRLLKGVVYWRIEDDDFRKDVAKTFREIRRRAVEEANEAEEDNEKSIKKELEVSSTENESWQTAEECEEYIDCATVEETADESGVAPEEADATGETATDKTAVDLEAGFCRHKCASSCLHVSTPKCCACADDRPYSESYLVYVDGIGDAQQNTRWEGYCQSCEEFWHDHAVRTELNRLALLFVMLDNPKIVKKHPNRAIHSKSRSLRYVRKGTKEKLSLFPIVKSIIGRKRRFWSRVRGPWAFEDQLFGLYRRKRARKDVFKTAFRGPRSYFTLPPAIFGAWRRRSEG
ncbi:hypothetical protein BU16DRAFT_586277 [Lophium mytilinum]|uniref:Uncharacterized protein n=1 Tax=Lophium mytilinum TaxID=390894 RepID=A0A6A6QA63_9PEZI|nr:hypothetical protein BU16DRAFT_586277 [Lophium mytilinum]